MARNQNRDKDLVEVMRNASFVLDIGRVIITAVMSKNGKIAQLRRLLNDPARQERIADIILADDLAQLDVQTPARLSSLTAELPAMIMRRLTDFIYTVTIKQLCVRRNFPGYIHPAVTDANFPTIHRGAAYLQLEVTFVQFARGMTDAEVDVWCETHNFRRATALELLTFGASYHQFLVRHPIVSGQEAVVDGVRVYVALDSFSYGRGVRLARAGASETWIRETCFMLFSKVAPP